MRRLLQLKPQKLVRVLRSLQRELQTPLKVPSQVKLLNQAKLPSQKVLVLQHQEMAPLLLHQMNQKQHPSHPKPQNQQEALEKETEQPKLQLHQKKLLSPAQPLNQLRQAMVLLQHHQARNRSLLVDQKRQRKLHSHPLQVTGQLQLLRLLLRRSQSLVQDQLRRKLPHHRGRPVDQPLKDRLVRFWFLLIHQRR
ncbi:hypothetical protein DL95DRAFT_73221 [Leptodontidium sp. 2 PMI_412]|nr:hypothetical protein DL95DRAFT_73221 [Leptodontidium sp. 2 PMI_412]